MEASSFTVGAMGVALGGHRIPGGGDPLAALGHPEERVIGRALNILERCHKPDGFRRTQAHHSGGRDYYGD